MFLFDVPPLMVLAVFPFNKVSSLYTHIDIVKNSLVNDNNTKHAFLRANRMGTVGASYLIAASEGAWL